MHSRKKSRSYCLVVSCPDGVGIVAAISTFIAQRGGSLIESNHHTDIDKGWFFLHNVITASSMSIDLDTFREEFSVLAEEYAMEHWHIRDSGQPQKLALLASHASHCLADLLHRWQSGELACDICCVVSNHDNLREMVKWHNIPFYHVPTPLGAKADALKQSFDIVDKHGAETVVLARYMQIIPDEICSRYHGRLINIHHSFLPSFIGANPYQKAFERGVKLIGATSHYVTGDLDEGPIIDQDVIRVNHSCDTDDMVRLGRGVESSVLARAVRYHLEDRVIIHGNKTVVFS